MALPLWPIYCHIPDIMRYHASCVARPGPDGVFEAVLLRGPAGSGKSDLVLRLLKHGFCLVADDQVLMQDGFAGPPPGLAGMLEVRGLGLFRLDFVETACVRLVVQLGIQTDRLPEPEWDDELALPVVTIDPGSASAPDRVQLALDAACKRVTNIVGAFAA